MTSVPVSPELLYCSTCSLSVGHFDSKFQGTLCLSSPYLHFILSHQGFSKGYFLKKQRIEPKSKSNFSVSSLSPLYYIWAIKSVDLFVNLFFWAPKSLQMVTAAMKLKDAYSLEGKLWPT